MTTHAPARRAGSVLEDLDREVASATAGTVVVWRGEHVPLVGVPERISRVSLRVGRELLYGSWVDAVEALNPLHARRLAAWKEAGLAAGDASGALEADLAELAANAETPYYAALRRYLALIGIEQGDASEADLWHVLRGSSWVHWFGEREVVRALAATGRPTDGDDGGFDGWRAAEHRLGSGFVATDPTVAAGIGHAYASLVGSPEWLAGELRVDPEGVGQFVDFAAFVRLWRIRRHMALLTYERRLFDTDDPALQRAYYAGIVGHQTGVALAEAGYLVAVPRPGASADELRELLLGGMLVDVLERDHGSAWWRDSESARLVERLAASASTADAIAQLGYDGLDWRPVLRQIRTRLIGEMSGYGGPNITTRAGTRKV